ncbi:MAG: hypothetical protein ACJAUN_001293 [Alcanivorax sp.]
MPAFFYLRKFDHLIMQHIAGISAEYDWLELKSRMSEHLRVSLQCHRGDEDLAP